MKHEGESEVFTVDAHSAPTHCFAQLMGHNACAELGPKKSSRHAPPLPTKFLLALAGKALNSGNLRFAVLRTKELQASHFLFRDPGFPVLLSLPATKSGQHLRYSPEGAVSDATVIAHIRAVVPRLRPDFVHRTQSFFTLLKKAVHGHPSSRSQLATFSSPRRCNGTLPGIRISGKHCHQIFSVAFKNSQFTSTRECPPWPRAQSLPISRRPSTGSPKSSFSLM